MTTPKLQLLISSLCFLAAPLNAQPSSSLDPAPGGLPPKPQVLSGVAITLMATTDVDIYCASSKSFWPAPPVAKGKISVAVPGAMEAFVAGDGAPKEAYEWKQTPKPLPQYPTTVTYTCANSRLLPAGVYGWSENGHWAPGPVECWTAPPFNVVVNVSGGFVDPPPGPGVHAGTIYIPRLKTTTVKVAPADVLMPDGNKSRKTIGVGEMVDLALEYVPSGDVVWTESGAHEISSNGPSRETSVTASDSAGNISVSASQPSSGISQTVDLSVLIPASMTHHKKPGAPRVGVNRVGASMVLDYLFHPTTVSFSNMWWREEGFPDPGALPQGMTGFYSWMYDTQIVWNGQNLREKLQHNPGFGWRSLDDLNREQDYAAIALTIDLWPQVGVQDDGSFYWDIPITWRIKQKVTEHSMPTPVRQHFELFSDGSVEIIKGNKAQIKRQRSEP